MQNTAKHRKELSDTRSTDEKDTMPETHNKLEISDEKQVQSPEFYDTFKTINGIRVNRAALHGVRLGSKEENFPQDMHLLQIIDPVLKSWLQGLKTGNPTVYLKSA